jgi:hypothetical protein
MFALEGAMKEELLSADRLRRMTAEKEAQKASEALRKLKAEQQEEQHRREMFMSGKITDEMIARLMSRLQRAADDGRTELLIGQFPSAWCTDGGRAINNAESDWPGSLPGVGKEFYEFFERKLKPRGFKLRVEIINFPHGLPGDVGAYVSW